MTLNVVRHARRAVGFIWAVLFLVLVGFSLFTNLAPLTGRQLFVIVGGSMEPSIPMGSLVVATPTDDMSVVVGNVVTVRADNGVVFTHRVTQVVDLPEGRFFETKGDANTAADGGLVPARAIVGTADQHLPYAGYARSFLSTITGLVAAVAGLGALLLLYLLLGMIVPPARPLPDGAPKPATP